VIEGGQLLLDYAISKVPIPFTKKAVESFMEASERKRDAAVQKAMEAVAENYVATEIPAWNVTRMLGFQVTAREFSVRVDVPSAPEGTLPLFLLMTVGLGDPSIAAENSFPNKYGQLRDLIIPVSVGVHSGPLDREPYRPDLRGEWMADAKQVTELVPAAIDQIQEEYETIWTEIAREEASERITVDAQAIARKLMGTRVHIQGSDAWSVVVSMLNESDQFSGCYLAVMDDEADGFVLSPARRVSLGRRKLPLEVKLSGKLKPQNGGALALDVQASFRLPPELAREAGKTLGELLGREALTTAVEGIILRRAPEQIADVLKRQHDGRRSASGEASAGKQPAAQAESGELHMAAAQGALERIDRLLEAGMDVNSVDEAGRSALFYSIAAEQLQTTRHLIRKGAQVNQPDWEGMTPLHVAATEGHTGCCSLLLSQGAQSTVKVKDTGRTPLHLAALNGTFYPVWLLVVSGASIDARDAEGCTALQHSLALGGRSVPLFLIWRGADVNSANKEGVTVLETALQAKCIDAACELIKHGADITKADEDGSTVLHFAAKEGLTQLATVALSKGARVNALSRRYGTPLHIAAGDTNPEMLKLLLDAGGAPNTLDARGRTALHIAAGKDDPEVLKLLLDADGDPNIRDSHGNNALHLLSGARGHKDRLVEMAKLLISAGVEVDSPIPPEASGGDAGYTPLHKRLGSRRYPNDEYIEILLTNGADVNARTGTGETPLHLAVAMWDPHETAKVLLAHGAEVNASDNNGNTPLHLLAAERTHLWQRYRATQHPNRSRMNDVDAAISVLLANGAKSSLTNKRGETALDLSRSDKILWKEAMGYDSLYRRLLNHR